MSEIINPEENMTPEEREKKEQARDAKTEQLMKQFGELDKTIDKINFLESLSQRDIMIFKELETLRCIFCDCCKEGTETKWTLKMLMKIIYNYDRTPDKEGEEDNEELMQKVAASLVSC